jgi:hypothetical protein
MKYPECQIKQKGRPKGTASFSLNSYAINRLEANVQSNRDCPVNNGFAGFCGTIIIDISPSRIGIKL